MWRPHLKKRKLYLEFCIKSWNFVSAEKWEPCRSDYLSDDVEIQPETDSVEAGEFVDKTLAVYSLENIENGLAKIRDGFLMAAEGYENIRHELPNLDPMEIPQTMEQVLMPQLNELSKPLQQLLTKTTKKNIIKFIQQLLNEGQSIHNIKKEYRLPYNLVYEVGHGTKCPGDTQYQKRRAKSPKSHKGKTRK